jgi:hypothetical protein
MAKLLFSSILIVPVFLGLELGRMHPRRRSLPLLLALLLGYDIVFMLLLYYIKGRWI